MVNYPLVIMLGFAFAGAVIWLVASLYDPTKKKKKTEGNNDQQHSEPNIYICDLESYKKRALYNTVAKKYRLNLVGMLALMEMSREARRHAKDDCLKDDYWHMNQ